jgi:hypothetical protein
VAQRSDSAPIKSLVKASGYRLVGVSRAQSGLPPSREQRRLDLHSHFPDNPLVAQPVPLTEAALAQLNSSESISEMDQRSIASSTISASEPGFENELRRRRVRLLTDDDEQSPDDYNIFKNALAGKRESPEPDGEELTQIRSRLRKASNEGGTLQGILPKIL